MNAYHVPSCNSNGTQNSPFFSCNCGVRQGENLSPILFSLFLNDLGNYLESKGHHGIELTNPENDIATFLKIIVLLYADDTVLIAENAQTLQNCLNDFADYCKTWKLNINKDKTKVIIFGSRQNRNFSFKIDNTFLEIVNSYKYLGVFLAKSGSFLTAKKHLAQQARKAMHLLYSRINNLNLPIDLILKLFDNTILPILTYSAEVWGYESIDLLEKIHNEFLRKIFNLRKSSPLYMIYAEFGRYPIDLTIKCRMIAYWNRLITGKPDKLAYLIFKYMLNLPNFESKWINYVKNIFTQTGRNYIWLNQDQIQNKNIKYTIKGILLDQYQQTWHTSLQNSTKGLNYSIFKDKIELEKYLITLTKYESSLFIKLRTGNHFFPNETGRWTNQDINERTCPHCTCRDVADEFHYMLICPFFNEHRRKFIKNTTTVEQIR